MLLSTSTASWIYDVAFFFSHTSNLGFVAAKNVLCNMCWLLVCQSPYAHLVWGFVALVCWNVLLRLFTEYTNLQHSIEAKKCWSLGFPLCPGIICSKEGLCNGCRQLLVIWMAKVKNNTKRADKHHFHFNQWLLQGQLFGNSSSAKKSADLSYLKFSSTRFMWWHCTATMMS